MDFKKLRLDLIKKTKEQVRENYLEKDVHIIKAINLIDELDKKINELSELVIEWYGVHFPELQYIVLDQEKYLQVACLGSKEKMSKSVLKKVLDDEQTEQVLSALKDSMGPELDEGVMSVVVETVKSVLDLRKTREMLTEFVEKEMVLLLPNFCALCPPVLAARFLAQAGSLKKLVMLPSSTLQVFGAEKALFRHLKGNGKSPKHGFLFGHPLIRSLKPWQRGKMARSLAGKLSIALKEDFFGGKNISKELQKDLDERLSRIRKESGLN